MYAVGACGGQNCGDSAVLGTGASKYKNDTYFRGRHCQIIWADGISGTMEIRVIGKWAPQSIYPSRCL